MENWHDLVAAAAAKLAGELPLDTARIVAGMIEASPDLRTASRRMAELPHPHYRKHAAQFLAECIYAAPGLSPQSVALALLAAARCERAHRDEQSVELVWTGPDASAVPTRHTEQAILQVLDSARHRISVVRSAVYTIATGKRAVHANGKTAILHVKCAVADGRWLFLSSANLTEYAFTINAELGVLITGGELPGKVEAQFDRLISLGIWEPV
jgi:phosphatidylserine/phosphatidylglycerophosphate/cardiolipin synthase-like enzyme